MNHRNSQRHKNTPGINKCQEMSETCIGTIACIPNILDTVCIMELPKFVVDIIFDPILRLRLLKTYFDMNLKNKKLVQAMNIIIRCINDSTRKKLISENTIFDLITSLTSVYDYYYQSLNLVNLNNLITELKMYMRHDNIVNLRLNSKLAEINITDTSYHNIDNIIDNSLDNKANTSSDNIIDNSHDNKASTSSDNIIDNSHDNKASTSSDSNLSEINIMDTLYHNTTNIVDNTIYNPDVLIVEDKLSNLKQKYGMDIKYKPLVMLDGIHINRKGCITGSNGNTIWILFDDSEKKIAISMKRRVRIVLGHKTNN